MSGKARRGIEDHVRGDAPFFLCLNLPQFATKPPTAG